MVAPQAFADDPLRVLRAGAAGLRARASTIEPETVGRRAASARRAGADVAQERVFAELQAAASAPTTRSRGPRAARRRSARTAAVLPELAALRGVEQTRYHHLDAHGHTLEVLERAIELERDPAAVLGAEPARARRARCSPSRWPTS